MIQKYAIDRNGNVGFMVRLCGVKFRGRGSWFNQERGCSRLAPLIPMFLEMFPCSLEVHV
jgi:hypothetical protein